MARSTAVRKWVDFEIQAEPGSKVYICGTFNDWDSKQIRLHERNKDGLFKTSLLLSKGRHEYKFVVNGEWRSDPKAQEWAPNSVGSANSVAVVE